MFLKEDQLSLEDGSKQLDPFVPGDGTIPSLHFVQIQGAAHFFSKQVLKVNQPDTHWISMDLNGAMLGLVLNVKNLPDFFFVRSKKTSFQEARNIFERRKKGTRYGQKET